MPNTNPVDVNGLYARAEEKAYVAAEQLHRVFNSDATTEVQADDGPIPSLRKALVDNFYFKDPIDWVIDDTETVFNQPRKFVNPTAPDDVTYWFAPGATSTNVIAMGGSPFGDDNWQPWVNGYDKGNPLISWAVTVEQYGQKVINVPFKFKVVGNVFINGAHQDPDQAYEYDRKVRTVTFAQGLEIGDNVVIQFGVHGGIVPSLIKQLEAIRDQADASATRAENAAVIAETESSKVVNATLVGKQVNNLHTTRDAIAWSAGLRVTDTLQLYVHDGVEYLPKASEVPFTTGASFEAFQWVLNEIVTKSDLFNLMSDTVYSAVSNSNFDTESVVIGGLVFDKTGVGLTSSELVITQSDFYFTTRSRAKYTLSESTTKISGASVGVGDGVFDCLGLIQYCAKRGISLDLSGGGRYLVKYNGGDNTCAIAGSDIINGFKLTTDSAVIEKDNTVNSRIMFKCISERAALFEYNRYGFNIENLLVESVNVGKGVILYASEGGAHYSNIGSITGINMYQTVNLQRVVYLYIDWLMSLDCVKAPQIYNNMQGAEIGVWVWNATGGNGWYNNEIQIKKLMIFGATEASAIVVSDLKIGQIDISRCIIPASGILAFGRNDYKYVGNINIDQFYSEFNINASENPIVTFDNVFDVKINQVSTTEGSESEPVKNIFTFKNSKNITIPSPKNYGFIGNYITADNSLVKVTGESSTGYLLDMFKAVNGGRVYCEAYKMKKLLFSGIVLTDEYQNIGEPLIEDIMYSVKGFEYCNGIATAFSVIIKPNVDLPIVTSSKIDFKVIKNPIAKGYLLQAKKGTNDSLTISQMVTESMNDYVS